MRRVLGYLFGTVSVAAFCWDIWKGPFQQADLRFTSTAEYWSNIHVTSLIGLNSYIEKQISPDLWDLAVLPAISWPAFVLAGALAFFFFAIAPKRMRKGRGALMFPRK